MDKVSVFKWSKEITKCHSDIIDTIVRIDITFSKSVNNNLAFYGNKLFVAKEEFKDSTNPKSKDIEEAWKGYDKAFEFQKTKGKTPIDYLDENEKEKPWITFPLQGECNSTFEKVQQELSNMIFDNTKNNKVPIKQIIVFPNIVQDGFGSNCIVALSKEITSIDIIYALMAECVRRSYKDSLEEFSMLLRKGAIKSAKAAIMSRNLSHNLGSHVMAYMKQDLSSVEDMKSKGVLEDAISRENESLEGKEIPYLVGMGKFLSYLQERQDYIATISTDYIPYLSIVNFKDAIYDELNPDYRFERHSDWKGHKPTNILLENIAKSEGLSRKTIKINYCNFDGLDKNAEDYENLRKWNFSLPGGIMGRQAVFSIVENVIRNSAKHGSRKEGEDLIITFDIKDPMCDNIANDDFLKEYLEMKEISDLFIVTLTDNVKTDPERVNAINDILKDPFYSNGEDLAVSNKGLKEMVISAAWLRNIKIEELTAKDFGLANILKARNTTEGFLQYVFCLPKVKEVALITEDDELKEKAKVDVWKKCGWYVYSCQDYLQLPSKNFNFILLDNPLLKNQDLSKEEQDNILNELKKTKEEIRKCSNNRFFVVANKTDLEAREIEFDITACRNYLDEQSLRDAEKRLYSNLAAPNGETFEISISDKGQNNSQDSKLVTKLADEETISKKQYIYRKHNDTDGEFIDFLHNISHGDKSKVSSSLEDIKFIEGITGGNSTDRLIRRAQTDDTWAYQHFHAMNTKVAIFDERLFTKITGYEMSQLKEGKIEIINWKEKLKDMDDNKAQEYVISYDLDRKKMTSLNTYNFLLYTKQEVIDFANKNYPESDTVCDLTKISSLVYHKKGIDVFTWTKIFENDNEARFAIWGIKLDLSNIETNKENDKWKENKYGRIEKIAELTIRDNNPEIVFKGDLEYCFDYVSIHQGLLDKIYEKMTWNGLTDEEKSKIKLMVTKAFHEKFAKSSCTYSDYLPGFTIHSGRSKPNQKDMPQHQPFIQYSAIENAVSDCKFTLVELFDFACYE